MVRVLLYVRMPKISKSVMLLKKSNEIKTSKPRFYLAGFDHEYESRGEFVFKKSDTIYNYYVSFDVLQI